MDRDKLYKFMDVMRISKQLVLAEKHFEEDALMNGYTQEQAIQFADLQELKVYTADYLEAVLTEAQVDRCLDMFSDELGQEILKKMNEIPDGISTTLVRVVLSNIRQFEKAKKRQSSGELNN